MRLALASALLCLAAANAHAADPVYLDELVETPLATLQQRFTTLKKEGCYAIASNRFLAISIDKKDAKPWRVTLAAEPPCRRPENGPAVDVRARSGVELGETTGEVVRRLGRPDAAAPPEATQKRLGETEYFFICRISEGCARHTSVFVRQGVVSAISEWYSE
jgi:hypothetical protein